MVMHRELERPVLLHLPSILHKHWRSSWAVITSIEALGFSLTRDKKKMAMHPHGALRQEKLHKQSCKHSPWTLHVRAGLLVRRWGVMLGMRMEGYILSDSMGYNKGFILIKKMSHQ